MTTRASSARAAAAASVIALALAACPSPPDARDAGACPPPSAPRVFATASDYGSGDLCALGRGAACGACALSPHAATLDAVLAWHGPTLVVMNYEPQRGQDNVTYVDVSATPTRVLGQVPMRRDGEAAGGNARAYLALDARRAYVARFNHAALAIVDREALAITGAIDLAGFTAGAPLPNPGALALVERRALVAIGRLPAGLSEPTTRGAVVAIDPRTDRVVDADAITEGAQAIELAHANPVGALAVRGRRVFVACVGAYQRADDGAVEELDAATLRRVGDVVTEADLGGNVDAVVALDDDRLLLRVSDRAVGSGLEVARSRLVEWSMGQRRAREWIAGGVPGYSLTEPIVARDGRVYVGDRGDEATRRAGGVRVFDAQSGREITSAPIGLSLPPYDLVDEP